MMKARRSPLICMQVVSSNSPIERHRYTPLGMRFVHGNKRRELIDLVVETLESTSRYILLENFIIVRTRTT